MGRLAKTGLAILGLAALGGFVSLLGGPSVFSPFSNAISTLFPESELAVEKTEEKQTQDKVPTDPKPEEQKELSVETTKEEVEEEIAAAPVIEETTPTVAALTAEPKAEEQVQSSVIAPPITPVPTPSRVLKPQAKRVATSGSGGESDSAPSRNQGSGADGSGIWCVTGGKSFVLKTGESCGGWNFEVIQRLHSIK